MNAERRAPRIGPGLRKTRGEPLYRVEEGRRFRSSDAGWRTLLENADIVSEGALRSEVGGGQVWYGFSSLIVSVREETMLAREELAEVAARDPHLRLRVIRHALREAEAKSGATLGSGQCDVRVSSDPLGLRIEIDVQAPLIRGRGRGRMSSTGE